MEKFEQNINESIVNILENFEFDEVQKNMSLMNYTWGTSSTPPTIAEIISTVVKMLLDIRALALESKRNPTDFPVFIDSCRLRVTCNSQGIIDIYFCPVEFENTILMDNDEDDKQTSSN